MVPTCAGLALLAEYTVTISYAAPRFLLPVYALASIPAAQGLLWGAGFVASRLALQYAAPFSYIGVRYALGALKGVGEKAMEQLVVERQAGPFRSLDDFAARIDPRLVNRRQIESLAGGGAFGGLEKVIQNRSEKSGIGFGATVHTKSEKRVSEIFREVEPEEVPGEEGEEGVEGEGAAEGEQQVGPAVIIDVRPQG